MTWRWRPPASFRGIVPVGSGAVSWLALFDDRTLVRLPRPEWRAVAVFDDRERPLGHLRGSSFGPMPDGARVAGVVVDTGVRSGTMEVLPPLTIPLAPLVAGRELAAEEIGDTRFPGRRGPADGCVACGAQAAGALCDRCQGVLDAADRDRAATADGPARVVPLARTVTGLPRPLDLLGIEVWPASFTVVAVWAGRFARLPPMRLDLADDHEHRYTGVVRQVATAGSGTELVWSAVPALAADAHTLRVVVRGAGGPLVDLEVPIGP